MVTVGWVRAIGNRLGHGSRKYRCCRSHEVCRLVNRFVVDVDLGEISSMWQRGRRGRLSPRPGFGRLLIKTLSMVRLRKERQELACQVSSSVMNEPTMTSSVGVSCCRCHGRGRAPEHFQKGHLRWALCTGLKLQR